MNAWNYIPLKAAVVMLAGSAIALAEPDSRWMDRSRMADVTPLSKTAYEQIALLKTCKLTQWMNPGGMDIRTLKAGDEYPVKKLYEMGFDTLPALVEALDDSSATTVFEPGRNSGFLDSEITADTEGVRVWKVNELIGLIISGIAEYKFSMGDLPMAPQIYVGEGLKPESVLPLQRTILDWYAENRSKSTEERKITFVSDGYFRNRMDAVEWLGKNRVVNGVPEIIKLIDRLLTGKDQNTLVDSEMAGAALALGQIGEKSGLPAVVRVCASLEDGMKTDSAGRDNATSCLIQASQGRTLLEKQ